ncbi:MAG: hypothetical protein U9O56_09535 [Campylobacterota bacterium]|nr:hypothetical protein [Campylobacterota bacterium]
MIDNIEEYFETKLNEAFQNDFEIYIQYHSISTNIDWDDALLSSLDFGKCKEIFPNFTTRYIEYEYPSEDMISGNETAQEVHFAGIDISKLTKNQVDDFCDIMANGYSKSLNFL